MADFRQLEDDASSRTEAPSAARRDAARRAGDVPRSDEFSNWLTLALASGVLAVLGAVLWNALTGVLDGALRGAGQPPSVYVISEAFASVAMVAILLGAIFAAYLVAPLLQSGWVWVSARDGYTPPGVLARMADGQSLYAGVRLVLKCLIALGIAALTFDALPRLASDRDAAGLASAALPVLQHALFSLLSALAALAVLDAGWQWWCWWRRNAMSWRAAHADAQADEASPQIRAALWQRRQSAPSRRAVPDTPDGAQP